MQFSWLEGVSKKWRGILVIGRTIERDGKKNHIVGMTMEEARSEKEAHAADDPEGTGDRELQLHAVP